MPFLVFLLVLIALILFWQAARSRKASGLPGGRVIYADTRQWGPVEKPLYNSELGLTGKPDYLVEQDGQIIPVEVKSSHAPEAPYDSHIFQLAAYCLLVERVFGKRPAYGILHYPNRTFAIDYTAQLENTLLDLLLEMRSQASLKDVPRSHESTGRCKGCGYRSMCEQRLGKS